MQINNYKNNICIILIGSASSSYGSGQLSNMVDIVSNGVSIILIDPQHKKESDEFLFHKTGLPINRGSVINGFLNVIEVISQVFFQSYKFESNTFYVVLSFTGISLENPSWNIAKMLGAKNRFWKNTKNALFLSMGCDCSPPDLLNLLINLKLNPRDQIDIDSMQNNLFRLFFLQNVYYAFQNNIDAISRAYFNENKPEWIENSLKKLRKIGINNIEEAHEKYLQFVNIPPIYKTIKNELIELNLNDFWQERKFRQQALSDHI